MPVEQLAIDLEGSQKKEGYDVTGVYIETIVSDEEFEITKDHLLKLCNDTLNGKLKPIDLNTISFAIISSEFFHWDKESKDTVIIEDVIYDWDNPEIGYDLTIKNIALWKHYLETGEYNFDKNELKEKFRNDGK